MATKPTIERLLALGPLPPPPSGSNVSFQVFCDHLTEYTNVCELDVIDSSPKRIKENTSILTLGNLRQAARQLTEFGRQIGKADCAIIFGSNQFLLSLTPLLVAIARLRGKPCYVRSFGGSLDQFSQGLHPALRAVLLWGFRNSTGLMVETQLLYRHFAPLLGDKVHYVTAYRPLSVTTPSGATEPAFSSTEAGITTPESDTPERDTLENDTRNSQMLRSSMPKFGMPQLRLVFISWVRAEKGVRALLAALQLLSLEEQAQVQCDIYGPIVDAYAAEFNAELIKTDGATYGGELDNADVLETMQQYDGLIFPTFYQGEGYPGVIVESMAAGLPVITTHFRSIPDMVTNGVNGLLVAPEEPSALVDAIRSALQDLEAFQQMGIENKKRQSEYDVRTVLPQMVQTMEEAISASV